jgi:hypothetical protein
MRFRPLCVDYHARAQEIIATDRDIHARRMAALLLPNPSSLPCDSHPPSYSQNSTSNDGIGGLDDGRCDSYINNEEKRDENSSRVNTNTDDDSDDNVGRPIPGENNLSSRRVSAGTSSGLLRPPTLTTIIVLIIFHY